MFSILKWTPHHWVLFDDSHHSALPATTDIVECLGTSITNCIVLVTEPGTKGSTSKPWKHGFPWKGCWEFIGDIPTFSNQKLMKVLIFQGPGVCFFGPRLLLQVQNLQAMALAICQDSLEFCLMVDHDKFHKIMPSCSKYRKYHSRLTFSYHSKNCCMRLLGVAVWFDFLC